MARALHRNCQNARLLSASSLPRATIRNCASCETKVLDASGREVPFLTDEDELARQGDLGALSFESIYARRG